MQYTKKFYTQDTLYADKTRHAWINCPAHLKNIYFDTLSVAEDRIFSGSQYVPQFALYPHKNDAVSYSVVNIFEVIRRMRSDELKLIAAHIVSARETGDEAKRTLLKSRLPYITHSGVFIPRKNEGLTLPSFTYQLDIDKVEFPNQIIERVLKDAELEVLFISKSPSGNGVKGILFFRELMRLRKEWTWGQYRQAYHNLTKILAIHFKNNYGLDIDTQMKAISQPMYLFYAPDLIVHKNYKSWV